MHIYRIISTKWKRMSVWKSENFTICHWFIGRIQRQQRWLFFLRFRSFNENVEREGLDEEKSSNCLDCHDSIKWCARTLPSNHAAARTHTHTHTQTPHSHIYNIHSSETNLWALFTQFGVQIWALRLPSAVLSYAQNYKTNILRPW